MSMTAPSSAEKVLHIMARNPQLLAIAVCVVLATGNWLTP
jgi:hypothetical protein